MVYHKSRYPHDTVSPHADDRQRFARLLSPPLSSAESPIRLATTDSDGVRAAGATCVVQHQRVVPLLRGQAGAPSPGAEMWASLGADVGMQSGRLGYLNPRVLCSTLALAGVRYAKALRRTFLLHVCAGDDACGAMGNQAHLLLGGAHSRRPCDVSGDQGRSLLGLKARLAIHNDLAHLPRP